MKFDYEKIKEIIIDYLIEDGLDFELNTVQEIIDANVEFTDSESKNAYTRGLVVFADCLREYAQAQYAMEKK